MVTYVATYGLGEFWQSLSMIDKEFCVYFLIVSIYTLVVFLRVVLQLRNYERQREAEDERSRRPALDVLRRRLANLRQLHLFTLYLCGFCLAVSVPGIFDTLDNSKVSPINFYIEGLTFLFSFYSVIFFGLVVLHSLQWFASSRVERAASRLE